MRDHKKLRAFELADNIAIQIYQLTKRFPKYELYGLISQMRRSAISVPSNIVEGCARQSRVEYLRFLDIAFGSLRELHYQLNLTQRLGFVDTQATQPLEGEIIEAEKVLNALIRSLRKPFNPSA
jgi:four helix bundle protein